MTTDLPTEPSFLVLALRSAAYNVLFYVAMIGLMLIFVPLLLMPRHFTLWLARTWGLVSLWLLRVVVGTRVEFRGLDNIPPGPALFAPKHQSLLETFALLKHVPDFSYVLKRELTWIPFFGWYLMSARQIGIDRRSGRAALTQVVDGAMICFARGQSLFIFPEGTRRPVGAPPGYKKGVGTVYEGGRVPCVPVALNTGLFWPRRKFLRYPGVCVIEFLPAIPPGMEREAFMRTLQATIEPATDALVAQALIDQPWLAPQPTNPGAGDREGGAGQ